ncbi:MULTISPECIES: diaminopimelate epimerase [unclassified Paenibacillus]|uniref:diaminopimelate epimerase n=1 Tax=unclassified Paenibacillus TaxID=185978 RepID=UPI0009568D3C|nr:MULTISPECIES: diaminopimelate epimerase [unclassified Paenibacillus]ASS65367.1 diaminopimelate epimerase [Paenibacillus sp. RUD330]SIQ38581.1 Diaminopimelate epimerase [Paenibacillus sp. RU4X]SIQ60755.1 Diaminopimelate epimerase [Paenibacillus sp. RU4T]
MTLEVEFVKLNPTQNMTVLVITPIPKEDHAAIASRMMAYDHISAEQVGFVEPPRLNDAAARLSMAGGEFCGNACMALAALVAQDRSLSEGRTMNVQLEASGVEMPISCEASRAGNRFRCRVEMPLPRRIEARTITLGGQSWSVGLVRYAESTHLVLEVKTFSDSIRTQACELATLLGAMLDDRLIGVMLYKPDTSEMQPLVYVPSLGSIVWERGCGSGTASVGAYLCWREGAGMTIPLRQPGGTIVVEAEGEGSSIRNLYISGLVGIVARGKAYISD